MKGMKKGYAMTDFGLRKTYCGCNSTWLLSVIRNGVGIKMDEHMIVTGGRCPVCDYNRWVFLNDRVKEKYKAAIRREKKRGNI